LIYIEKQYQQPWASELARLLVEIKNTVDKTKVEKNYLSQEQHRLFEKRYDALITTGLEKNPFVEAKSIDRLKKFSEYF
jgi:hypothetical protein